MPVLLAGAHVRQGIELGTRTTFADLGQTLARIAGFGRDGFYDGGTAALIVYEMDKKNGLITAADLKNYHSFWRKPIEFNFRDLHIVTMPPPSSGGIILQQLLGMIAPFPLKSYGFHSAEAVHLMAEAERRSYADRAEHMGDPDFWKVPVRHLTDSTYLKSRMADFQADKSTPSARVSAGKFKESEGTSHKARAQDGCDAQRVSFVFGCVVLCYIVLCCVVL